MASSPSNTVPLPDEPTQDLIRAAKSGDTNAWRCLDNRYRVALTLFMRGRIPSPARSRFDTDDLLQSAFLSAFKELDTYEYRGEGSFLAWMSRILESRLKNRVRRGSTQSREVSRNEHYTSDVELLDSGQRTPSPSEIFSAAEDHARLLQAVADLEPDLRAIVTMHFFDKRPIVQVARELGHDAKTVRRRLSQAITILLGRLR